MLVKGVCDESGAGDGSVKTLSSNKNVRTGLRGGPTDVAHPSAASWGASFRAIDMAAIAAGGAPAVSCSGLPTCRDGSAVPPAVNASVLSIEVQVLESVCRIPSS